MNNIIDFPAKSIRDWVIIERALNDALKAAGMPPQVQKRLIEKMKDFHPILDRDFDFSIPTPPINLPADQVNAMCATIGGKLRVALKEQLNAFTQALFIERLYREIEACREIGLL